jgi:hypothetical protein
MSQLTAKDFDILANPLELLVLITKQNGELGEERVHHPSGSAHRYASHLDLSDYLLSAQLVASQLVCVLGGVQMEQGRVFGCLERFLT